MKVGALVEVRSHSTRLPGKYALDVGHGQTVLEMLMRRLKLAQSLDEIHLVCPDGDYRVMECAKDHGWSCVMGGLQDHGNVMKELWTAARVHDIDLIVEITGDCPMIDPAKVDETVALTKEGNVHFGAFLGPSGFEVRTFWRGSLSMALAEIEDYQRNGSTIFYRRKEWDVQTVPCGCTEPGAELKYSVDTEEDLDWIRKLYREVAWDAKYGEILAAGSRLKGV